MINSSLLHTQWFSYLSKFRKLIVGFSGGLDSTVLLHQLTSSQILASKLTAVHINHGISPQADAWQNHCQRWCQRFNVNFLSESVQFNRSANIEEEARNARYDFLSSLITVEDCLLLGHHQDDQAETLLLQLFRGAGIDGLAAMVDIADFGQGKVVRPFLTTSRQELYKYAISRQLSWVEDESNQDTHYTRNFLRQEIIPLLKEKWPGINKNLARTATHCQQAQKNLQVLAEHDCPELKLANSTLSVAPLRHLGFDRLVNVLREWLKINNIPLPAAATLHRLIHEVLFAREDATPEVSWGIIRVRRYQQKLYLGRKEPHKLPACVEWLHFPKALHLMENNLILQVERADRGLVIPPKACISIRYRQGGEQFYWHGQNKSLKKLFQEWAIPPWLRDRIPLLYVNEDLAAVTGYAISDLYYQEHPQAWSLTSTQVN